MIRLNLLKYSAKCHSLESKKLHGENIYYSFLPFHINSFQSYCISSSVGIDYHSKVWLTKEHGEVC